MPLKKFTANDSQLLKNIAKEDLYDHDFLKFHETSSTKTLGIKWNAVSDSFTYSISPIPMSEKITKRQILSTVAKLFDPAGWIAPVVITTKILMQKLWLEGLDWDDEVSKESMDKWKTIVNDISSIETIKIPRWIQFHPSDLVQIHGFSDDSKSAYCATVYIRCQTNSQSVFTNLLVAKSKVAPIQTICLPRLELNGAVLLAKLIDYVIHSFDFIENQIFLWTDSSIVLGWLSKTPSTWETYVANRIALIHQLAPKATWRHVSSHDNPADLGTRGCKPSELSTNNCWWYGPNWLSRPCSTWPNKNPLKSVEHTEKIQVLHTLTENNDILNNFSSYSRALRVICYIFRFFHQISKRTATPTTLSVSQIEIKSVKMRLLILAQKTFFLKSTFNSRILHHYLRKVL